MKNLLKKKLVKVLSQRIIITIIVMIILAAAIILTLTSSDIRGKAEEAINTTDISSAKEAVAVARSEWEVNYDKLKDKYGDSFKKYAEEKLKSAGIDYVSVSNKGAVNTKYKEENSVAIIPEGFVVSKATGENTIKNGLVIYEGDEPVTDENVEIARETRNQFVWVPVDDMDLFKRTTTYVLETVDDIEDPGAEYEEPYKAAGDPTGERAEHAAMEASVAENGGFYIARYEAGKEGTSTVVSKKGATVWNKIPWGTSMIEVGTNGAVYRARQMYKGSKSVVSTLCYGVQWDAALQFIATNEEHKDYPTNSDGKGYYAYDSNWEPIEGMKEEVQPAGYYAVNNIYDMAGNVYEWTMEANSTDLRVIRGGVYGASGSEAPASGRYDSYPFSADVSDGFRFTLYIK